VEASGLETAPPALGPQPAMGSETTPQVLGPRPSSGPLPACSQSRAGSGLWPTLVPCPALELLAAHPALGLRSASGLLAAHLALGPCPASGPRLRVQPRPGRTGSGPHPSAHRQGLGRTGFARVASNRQPPTLPRVRG
jgi:hypothetical protein